MAKRKSTRREFGSIRQRNGKFEASYKRGGKTHYGPQQFVVRSQAQEWLNGEESHILKGTWTPPGAPSPINSTWTLGRYVEHHINVQTTAKGLPLRPSTKEKYLSYLERGIAPLANLDLKDVTKSMVDSWYAELCASGKITTASKNYKLLHAVMGRALAEGYIHGANPCQVKGAQNASSNTTIRTLSMPEVGRVANAINPRFRRQVLIMANSGLRFGEAAALTLADIDFVDHNGARHAILEVDRAVTRLKNNTVIVGEPKSQAGRRRVVLNSALTPLLIDQIDCVKQATEKGLLFPSASGTYLRNDVFNKAIKSAAMRVGLEPKGISAHGLRRAGATELANVGANLAEVQEYLGDSSEKAALRYIKSTGRTQSLIENMKTGIEAA